MIKCRDAIASKNCVDRKLFAVIICLVSCRLILEDDEKILSFDDGNEIVIIGGGLNFFFHEQILSQPPRATCIQFLLRVLKRVTQREMTPAPSVIAVAF